MLYFYKRLTCFDYYFTICRQLIVKELTEFRFLYFQLKHPNTAISINLDEYVFKGAQNDRRTWERSRIDA